MGEQQRISGVWRAVDVVCDTPTLLLLEAIWFGEHRFTEFEKSTGLQKALISSRLKSLIVENILVKRSSASLPRGNGYYLTPMGLGLLPAALLMLAWELRWGGKTAAPVMQVVHMPCGHALGAVATCEHCGDALRPDDIKATKGPDFYVGETAFIKRRRQAGLARADIRLFDEIANILGDRWMALILRMALLGVKRFDAFESYIGISSNILSDRLGRAIDLGLMTQRAYQDNPPRHEYLLTEKAMDLEPIVLFLMQWGADWYDDGSQHHIYLTHSCGAALRPILQCSHCNEEIDIAETQMTFPQVKDVRAFRYSDGDCCQAG